MKPTRMHYGWTAGCLAAWLAGAALWAGGHTVVSGPVTVDSRDYTLAVSSAHGTPTPAVGTHTYAWGARVTCSLDDDAAGYDATGWTGTGSVPATGTALTTGELAFDDVAGNAASSITWNWVVLQQQGALTVTLAPTGALSAGAQWRVDGGDWQASGATVDGLALGEHTLSFKDVAGWITPAPQDASLTTPGQTVVRSVSYRVVGAVSGLWLDVPDTAMVGVVCTGQVGVEDGATPPVTFSAKGLPAGMKLNSRTGALIGTPTKAGIFTVTLTAKNKSGSVSEQTQMTVRPLPAWAQGTFAGEAFMATTDWAAGTETQSAGTVTISVSKAGKITGKVLCGGTSCSLSQAAYRSRDGDFEPLMVTGTLKVGKLVVWLEGLIEAREAELGGIRTTLSRIEAWGGGENGTAAVECGFTAYRNPWKDPGMAAVLGRYAGYYTAVLPGDGDVGSGFLAFTVDTRGAVKTAGKLADGTALSASSTLLCDAEGRFWTVVNAAPSAYKGGALTGRAEFVVTKGDGVVLQHLDGEPWHWTNLAPQATETYGEGFDREVGLYGGWYSKVIDLQDYYGNGLAVGGVGALPSLWVGTKITDVDWESEPPRKIRWTEWDYAGPAADGPEGLTLAVRLANGIGTGLAAPKPDKPLRLAEDGLAQYEYGDTNQDGENNASALTLSFTRATGLFKGSFALWYDYVSAEDWTREEGGVKLAHVSKKVAFQGILTPNRAESDAEGRGFFLWADQSAYDTGKMDRDGEPIMKTYRFNRSYDFWIGIP